MPDLEVETCVFCQADGLPEGGQLFVGFFAVRFIGDGQVGEDPHHAQQAFLLVGICGAE